MFTEPNQVEYQIQIHYQNDDPDRKKIDDQEPIIKQGQSPTKQGVNQKQDEYAHFPKDTYSDEQQNPHNIEQMNQNNENSTKSNEKNITQSQIIIQITENKEEILTKTERLGLIRKIYAILLFQMLMTVIACIFSIKCKKFAQFQTSHSWLIYPSIGIAIVICSSMAFFKQLAKAFPFNYTFIFIFALSVSYAISYICSEFNNSKIVLMAASLAASVIAGLTIYSFFNKSDFTIKGGVIFVLFSYAIMIGILFIIYGNMGKILEIVATVIIIIFYCIILLYYTHLLMKKNSNKFQIDDHIQASMLMYINIMLIFMCVIGGEDDE